jgi:hypothetical protein
MTRRHFYARGLHPFCLERFQRWRNGAILVRYEADALELTLTPMKAVRKKMTSRVVVRITNPRHW